MGVAACLYRQGLLPNPNDTVNTSSSSIAGFMVAVACLAGVDPERDRMEVILEASRKMREYADAKPKLVPYLDVLTPGFSLIDDRRRGRSISEIHRCCWVLSIER